MKEIIGALNDFGNKFVNKYYKYDDGSIQDFELMNEKHTITIFVIGDEYWDLNDIYIALLNDIPEKILFDWYYFALETHGTDKFINLYNYNLQRS